MCICVSPYPLLVLYGFFKLAKRGHVSAAEESGRGQG